MGSPPDKVPELVAVVGATGTGKSEFSLRVADALDREGRAAEVINADAMQLYRGMDIGTAKLTAAERSGVPHHLLDVLDVTDEASVAAYQPAARAAIDEVLARDAVPVLVGGSGLYVSSVIHDFRFPARDEAVRLRLEDELERVGAAGLYERLHAIDPEAAERVGGYNGRRLVRALEVVELTGEPLSGTLPETPIPWRTTTLVRIGVERARLVERLDRRVERMWDAGLVEEARSLVGRGLRDGVTASRAIGYAQALAQLDGTATAEEAIADAQALTRRYARRQVSWFKRYERALDVDGLDADDVVSAVGRTVRSLSIAALD
ncbi:tRNA (adenosine(37)-N6)-dimethylallyltransferase MiaA [Herbiconiux moechotypicola]|uniref:tRNA dimethylallyltransferase n=1 Tax=Herbiconiux moechotypicola TaxID=637393 RepID=A0ABP5QE64_9MICO|nr:tRNA (adenosine(37)-N6)-dimethylallyltransferase MiaA [Herbiconiux moechotypicola]MCS5729888.1 tRNA (adenosine(37)-N6)-dimethylallyltransferase MiaA [Herbiconiux moechotypicola]